MHPPASEIEARRALKAETTFSDIKVIASGTYLHVKPLLTTIIAGTTSSHLTRKDSARSTKVMADTLLWILDTRLNLGSSIKHPAASRILAVALD